MTNENVCSICGKKILVGEAIHGARGDHWDCVYPKGAPPSLSEISATLDESIQQANEALYRLRANLGAITSHPNWKKRTR